MSNKFAAVIENDRALVKVVVIDSITPIKKADFIELAHIGGWQCVVKKGEFNIGDKGLYCEIDSLLPVTNPAFAFLAESKSGLKTFDDVVYSRIRTIKLKGEISQGLLVPLPEAHCHRKVGDNLTNVLEVRKFEEVIPNTDGLDGRLNSSSKSFFDNLVKWVAGPPTPSLQRPWPSALSKSDQERVQNVGKYYAEAFNEGEEFEETVKADGMSLTVYSFNDMDEAGPIRRYGVCTRNYDMSVIDVIFTPEQATRRFLALNLIGLVNGVSSVWRTAKYLRKQVNLGAMTTVAAIKELASKKYFWFTGYRKGIYVKNELSVNYVLSNRVLEKLSEYNVANNDTITLQGELIGPGIQSNYEKVETHQFYVYQVYRNGKLWVSPTEAKTIVESMGLKYIPVLNERTKLPENVKACLNRAKGTGAFNPEVKREGIVFKSLTRDFSFKVISNDYLLRKEVALDVEE